MLHIKHWRVPQTPSWWASVSSLSNYVFKTEKVKSLLVVRSISTDCELLIFAPPRSLCGAVKVGSSGRFVGAEPGSAPPWEKLQSAPRQPDTEPRLVKQLHIQRVILTRCWINHEEAALSSPPTQGKWYWIAPFQRIRSWPQVSMSFQADFYGLKQTGASALRAETTSQKEGEACGLSITWINESYHPPTNFYHSLLKLFHSKGKMSWFYLNRKVKEADLFQTFRL